MLSCSSRKRWLPRRVKKNLFAGLLVSDVVQEIETLLGRQAVEELDLEALELAVRQQALQLAEPRSNNVSMPTPAMSEAHELVDVAARAICRAPDQTGAQCPGAPTTGARLLSLRLLRHGYCPRDQHLGIENTSLSPALTRMTGTVGALVSFQEGSELLTELAGVAVDAKQVERTAEALENRSLKINACTPNLWMLWLYDQTLYLGMDGTGIPLRAEELVGRIGKQPDGSAKNRRSKTLHHLERESLDEEGTPIRDKDRSPTQPL